MKEKMIILIIALLFGIVSSFFSGTIFLFLVFGLIVYIIHENSDSADRKYIITVLVAGFLLRVSLAVLLHAANFIKGYHGISGDDLLYTVKSCALVYQWDGKPYEWVRDLAGSSPKYGLNPFVYLLAIFYKISGFHPLAAKFINCILGCLIGYFSYLIGKKMFDRNTARLSMFIVTFYPSIVRWSIANLKDPMIMFLFILCLYMLISVLVGKVQIWKILILLSSMAVLYLFTPRLYFILIAGAFVVAVFLRFFVLLKNRRQKLLLASLITIAIMAFIYYFSCVKSSMLVSLIYECEAKQTLMAKADFAGYYFYPGKFMDNLSSGVVLIPTFLNVIFKNVVYFMLTPFPWQITSPERLLSFPQMMLWYVILLLSFFGFVKLLVQKPAMGLLMIVLLIVGITASALAEGNIGSAFRHRDIFTPLFVIFASAIICDFMACKRSLKGLCG